MKKLVIWIFVILLLFNFVLLIVGKDRSQKSFQEVLVLLSGYNPSFDGTLDSVSSAVDNIEASLAGLENFKDSYHDSFWYFRSLSDVIDSFGRLGDFSDIFEWIKNFGTLIYDLLMFLPTILLSVGAGVYLIVEVLVFILPVIFALVIDTVGIVGTTLHLLSRLIS